MEELTVRSVPPAHEDDRGAIYNVIDDTALRSVLYVESDAGTVRGNHYHESQTQYPYVLRGGFTVYYRDRRREGTPPVETVEMETGDVMKIPPHVAHAFEIDRRTEFIEPADKTQGTDGRFYDRDTVEVDGLVE
jgi:dTDP-4-dehydrorhamnose 3,5-epimerase-like enzyme